MTKFEEDHQGLSVAKLGAALKAKKLELEASKAASTAVQLEYDLLRKKIVPEAMEKAEIESVKLKDVGRLSCRPEVYASIPADKKDAAMEWLKENGMGDIVKEGVNSSALKSLVKECIVNAVELPEELFTVSPYGVAVVTKN